MTDLKDASGQTLVKAGQQLDGFAQLRDDGTTMSGCWIFSGSYTEKGNQMARRDASDPREAGIAPNWAWAWPANRRILYNRASADPSGKPWNPAKSIIEWNGGKWVGLDVPDYTAAAPSDNVGPFIMNGEGLGRLFALDQMAEGPFPEHYEPFEFALGERPPSEGAQQPRGARLRRRPGRRSGRRRNSPMSEQPTASPSSSTSGPSTRCINAILQPEEFVEIGEALAKEKGIAQAGWVRVSCKRGAMVCKAYVTKRIKPLTVDGKSTHVIGVPLHWGFTGQARKGYGANTLTPSVGDANTQTPEFKAFLVNVEKVSAPVA